MNQNKVKLNLINHFKDAIEAKDDKRILELCFDWIDESANDLPVCTALDAKALNKVTNHFFFQ